MVGFYVFCAAEFSDNQESYSVEDNDDLEVSKYVSEWKKRRNSYEDKKNSKEEKGVKDTAAKVLKRNDAEILSSSKYFLTMPNC